MEELNYPQLLLSHQLPFQETKWIRGLILDTKLGNILKPDSHKYVRLAYHGNTRMPNKERKASYVEGYFNRVDSFEEDHYVKVDTLFQFVDCELWSKLIDMKDGLYDDEISTADREFLDERTYEEMYGDVREAVDLCHRDGVIKDEVARAPELYVEKDPALIPRLTKMRADGKKLFLVTNSLWDYTNVVMKYLCEEKSESLPVVDDWTKLFDVIVTASAKPAYLLDKSLPLYRVMPDTCERKSSHGYLLENTDGLYEISRETPESFLEKGNVFQGGSSQHLTMLLGSPSPTSILYVGDHLYSDVLRSKKTLGWRTALVVPELKEEIASMKQTMSETGEKEGYGKSIEVLRKYRQDVGGKWADELTNELRGGVGAERKTEILELLTRIRESDEKVKFALKKLGGKHHSLFNARWGSLFKSGYQRSRFSYYVENYACVYLELASELGFCHRSRRFGSGIGGKDRMAHEVDGGEWEEEEQQKH